MENIHARLDLKTRQMIERLESNGWEFQSDYWESGHNGDPYYDVRFRSPKMEDFARIGEHEWETITEKSLKKREAVRRAHEWVEGVFHYGHNTINSSVEKTLAEHLLKVETTEFKNEPEPKVSVKISPKVKSPKKVKITIEIT